MCSSCRDRFGLPVTPSGKCEVCLTLERLNRVILTRHPAEEASTLHRLLLRTVSKVEAFVEEWETEQAQKRPLFGVGSLGAGGSSAQEGTRSTIPGLTPVTKRASAPARKPSGERPCGSEGRPEERREDRGEAKEGRTRSNSTPKKKDKKRKRRSKEGSKEPERDRRRRKEKSDAEGGEPRKSKSESHLVEEVDFGGESEESPTREDKAAPLNSHNDESQEPRTRDIKVPRSPSRSPPGFRRNLGEERDDREPLARKPDKPKKDKGYNHYIRGQEFRDRYGFDRGRGRGAATYVRRW